MNTLADILKSGDLVRIIRQWFNDNPGQDRVVYIDYSSKKEIVIELAQLETDVRNG